MRPLYQTATVQPQSRDPRGNAGLWFDKFCRTWPKEKTWTLASDGKSNPKLAWIETVTNSPAGNSEELEEAALRLLRLAEARSGQVAVFKTQSRLVTGLGRSHPTENGFTWHHTLGVPYLPGSSIKGMVLAWARTKGIENHSRIFGTQGRVGAVCFLDAIPIQPVSLESDVMTPHYAGWDAANPPGDWCSPTPIPFLTTAVGAPFLFGVVPCVRAGADDARLIIDLVAEALKFVGTGAKTAVGYGRMERDENEMQLLLARRKQQDDEFREQARMAELTPIERDLAELAARNIGQASYLTWLQELENGRWGDDPATRAQVLSRVKEEMERSRIWKTQSNAKRPEKDRDHQRTLRVQQLMKMDHNL